MARILLIDDDDSVRTMLRLTLAHFGHTVIEARNGKEGLELFQHANADLLITDIVMPEKEGLEVLMELRKKHPPVKIIAISGGDYLHMAKLMGAAKVLAKPFSTNVLIEAIDELLPGRRSVGAVACGAVASPSTPETARGGPPGAAKWHSPRGGAARTSSIAAQVRDLIGHTASSGQRHASCRLFIPCRHLSSRLPGSCWRAISSGSARWPG